MVSRAELLTQAQRRYPDFLRAIVLGQSLFPLELRLGKTRRAVDYPGYQAELTALRTAANELGIQIEWTKVKALRFGEHERPERAWFAGEAEYLGALGKMGEVRAFREDLALIRAEAPALESWLDGNVRGIVARHGLWPRLLRVVRWFHQHPRCGLYLRQLPIPGVDTKFFENHSTILDDLITAAQPEQVDLTTTRFVDRHGLCREEPLIRFRFLDPALQAVRGFPVDDLSVPAPIFRTLVLDGVRAVITENLRNFLALPLLPGTVAVFGGGNALSLLAGSVWLTKSAVYYWGDIDAHGFLMLSRLRESFPQTISLMMDTATLDAGRDLLGNGSPATFSCPPKLKPQEEVLFDQIRGGAGCLEQERLPFDFVVRQLRLAIV